MVLNSPATIVPVAPMITLTILLLPDCMSSWIFSTFSSIFSKRVSRFLYLCSHKSTCASKFSFSSLVAILLLASNVNIALWKRPYVLPKIYISAYTHYLYYDLSTLSEVLMNSMLVLYSSLVMNKSLCCFMDSSRPLIMGTRSQSSFSISIDTAVV